MTNKQQIVVSDGLDTWLAEESKILAFLNDFAVREEGPAGTAYYTQYPADPERETFWTLLCLCSPTYDLETLDDDLIDEAVEAGASQLYPEPEDAVWLFTPGTRTPAEELPDEFPCDYVAGVMFEGYDEGVCECGERCDDCLNTAPQPCRSCREMPYFCQDCLQSMTDMSTRI